MHDSQKGFAPIQIILSILAGTILLGGVAFGVLYFSKQPSGQVQQGKCGDGVCGSGEKISPDLCPIDCGDVQQQDQKQQQSQGAQQTTQTETQVGSLIQKQGKCGDGICGPVEQAHPDACPQDCTAQTENSTSKNSTLTQDLKYSSINSDAVKLDLYLPSKTCSGKLPLVVMIHGGGFKGGDKRPARTSFLTDNCYAVASINYRLSGEALFPAGNQDVKAAVRWLRANATKYNLDPEHFGAMGGSAGGYYSSFLGTTGDIKDFDVGDNLNYSSAVQAVVDEYGLVDISTLAQDRNDAGLIARTVESVYMGCDIISATCTNATTASPANYVSKGDAPFIILHGGKDTQIPIKQSQDFYAKLLSIGIPATFTTVQNAGHGGSEFDHYEPQILEFFNKYLKK